ncbi:hypothetical protein ACHAWF_000874, partial [Thalassiosira exigua]
SLLPPILAAVVALSSARPPPLAPSARPEEEEEEFGVRPRNSARAPPPLSRHRFRRRFRRRSRRRRPRTPPASRRRSATATAHPRDRRGGGDQSALLGAAGAAFAVSGGGLDYAGLDISGQDFSGGNYKGKDFTQTIVKAATFAKSNLQGCRFYKAYLVSSSLCSVTCTFKDWGSLSKTGTSSHRFGTPIAKTNPKTMNRQVNADFSGSDARGASFEDTSMDGTNLRDINAAGSYFGQSLLYVASLEGGDFTDAQVPVKTQVLVCEREDVRGTNLTVRGEGRGPGWGGERRMATRIRRPLVGCLGGGGSPERAEAVVSVGATVRKREFAMPEIGDAWSSSHRALRRIVVWG